jgi:hypothetical protein
MFETAGPGGAVDQSSRIEAMRPRNYARLSVAANLNNSQRVCAWLGSAPDLSGASGSESRPGLVKIFILSFYHLNRRYVSTCHMLGKADGGSKMHLIFELPAKDRSPGPGR